MDYIYSATTNCFYPVSMKSSYIATMTWPADGVEIDEATFNKFACAEPPVGKIRGSNKKGYPAWVNAPLASKEQLVAEAEQQKQSLLAEANNAISPLQDAVDLEMATDEEVEQLTAWKTYRVYLNRVDTSTAPDIEWPVKP